MDVAFYVLLSVTQYIFPFILHNIKVHMSGNCAQYKYYRNKISKLMQISKKLYYHEFFNNNLNNPKKTWGGINGLLRRKKKIYMTIDSLKQPPSDIATNIKSRIPNILNEHFTSIGPDLANKIPPFEKHFTEYLDKGKSPVTSFFFTPIRPKEIKWEILQIIRFLLVSCQHT